MLKGAVDLRGLSKFFHLVGEMVLKRFLVIQFGIETTTENVRGKTVENEIKLKEIIRFQSLQGFSKDYFHKAVPPTSFKLKPPFSSL